MRQLKQKMYYLDLQISYKKLVVYKGWKCLHVFVRLKLSLLW